MRIPLIRFLAGSGGETAVTYALIAALISVSAIGALTALGGSVAGVFVGVDAKVPAGDEKTGDAKAGDSDADKGGKKLPHPASDRAKEKVERDGN